MKMYIRLIAASILVIGLSSCILNVTPTIGDISDGGLLSNQPCGAPCFQKIHPGITTEQDARNILHNLNLPCRDIDNPYITYKAINCQSVSMSFPGNIVGSISFYPSTKITFQAVIDKYGIPDTVFVYISSILPDEPQRSQMAIFYSRLQTDIILAEQNGRVFTVSPNTAIYLITYETENEYQDYQNLIANHIQSWKGFGVYVASLLP